MVSIYLLSKGVQNKLMLNENLTENDKKDIKYFIESINNSFIDVNLLSSLNGYNEINKRLLVETIKQIWIYGGLQAHTKLSSIKEFNETIARHWAYYATAGMIKDEDINRYEICLMRLWQFVTYFKVIDNGSDDPQKWDVDIKINNNFNNNVKFHQVVEEKVKTDTDKYIDDVRKEFDDEIKICEELYDKIDNERIKKLLLDRIKSMTLPKNLNNYKFGLSVINQTKQNILSKLIDYYKKTGEIIDTSTHKACKKIIQIDAETNEVIDTYNSTREAAEKTKINVSKISQCANHKLESYHGYLFHFDDDYNNNVKEYIDIKKQLKECTDKLYKLDNEASRYRKEIEKLITKKRSISDKIFKSLIDHNKENEIKYRKENDEINKDINYFQDKLNVILDTIEENS